MAKYDKEIAHRYKLRCTNKNQIRNLGEYLNFIFSEPCIMINICEKDQQDAHFFFNNLFQLIYLRHVSNKQLFIIRRSVQAAYSIYYASF